MSSLDTETLASMFLLPENIVIEAVYPTKSRLTLQVSCTLPSASCPECCATSERIHASYVRRVADVPCGGRLVTLALKVRKFVCHTPDCPRQIFTERLPDLVQPYARMTNRLREILQILGFATCGELEERLAPKLGMAVSGPTVLRLMRTHTCTSPESVHILGIDDWAWKKGQTYGTILVDLEQRKPIELLPDRTAETAEAWLRLHPEVDTVSRDRGGEYAAAARKGVPQAQQIADRFHLLKNLRESLKDFMEGKQSCLPELEERTSDAVPAKAQGIKEKKVQPTTDEPEEKEQDKHFRTMSPSPRERPAGMGYNEFHKQIRRDNRYARYEAVRTLYQQGLSQRKISRQLRLSRETVARYLKAEVFPERAKSPKKATLLDPYKPYILQRWQQGCWNGTQLYHEIKERGYTGSASFVRPFIADLRKKHQRAGTAAVLCLDDADAMVSLPASLPPKPQVTHRMSSTRASWLFVSKDEKLDEKQRKYVEQIRKSHPDLETAYQLSQGFVMMLAERRASDLDSWLTRAEQSGLPEFKKLANGIRRDYAAVRAAFSSEWSNGQVEAQVNCLKLQKRIVFGRANFDLLRLRVLCRI